jgi:YidC/Oxa1 family membrane protein insertase
MMSVIPDQVEEEAAMRLFSKGDGLLEAQYLNPDGEIRPGTQHTYHYSLFFGPKSMKILKQAGHDLGKALNFGWFTVLAKPCVWLMNRLYSVIPNYGIAIIILTVLIKIVLWPLGSKSYKSMSEMKKIQPLMKDIREKYKNDKKKMNEEVMGLYRTYKINPLGGCLPMVVQLPVFFALYRMLYQAIELRHAPFFLWIDDLSAPDRLFHFGFSIPFMEPPYGIPVLTIIMGATMLLQQKMSPPMGDPTQAKMMMFMPLIFTVIFINFSSGLVLYWLVNNILSISQQYYIQKKFA